MLIWTPAIDGQFTVRNAWDCLRVKASEPHGRHGCGMSFYQKRCRLWSGKHGTIALVWMTDLGGLG